jgi:hypothetical protein
MGRESCCFVAVLFCGVAACSDAPPDTALDTASSGGQQQTPSTGGVGGASGPTAPTSSGGVETGAGGVTASGGTASPGGTLAGGGAVGAGGGLGTGGAVAAGGAIGDGGAVSTGGSIDSGGGQGGRIATGGAGATGSTPMQGGATGSTTTVDLTCNTDDDCCVRVDTCRAIAVLYSKIQGLVYWPPSTSTSCLRCFTPIVEVSCRNNQCTGSTLTPTSNGTSHCGKLPSAGTGGTTGTTTATTPASGAAPVTPAYETTPQLVFGC